MNKSKSSDPQEKDLKNIFNIYN